MSHVLAFTLTALAGTLAGWMLTIPTHRFKELRPKSPRDVASEVGTADAPPPLIRASYREARCGSCHRRCTWRDVAPVISWIRGCPGCGSRLPATVPALQLGVPLAMLLTAARLDDPWVAVPYLWLVVVLAAVSVIDLRIWLIPYWMPWLGAAVGLVLISIVSIAHGAPERILYALGGAVGSFVLFFVLWFLAPGKLGFGDVRLAVLLGMFLAWFHPVLPIYGVLFGSVLGLVVGLGSVVARGDARFPFGPALALGAMSAVWLHEPILRGFG